MTKRNPFLTRRRALGLGVGGAVVVALAGRSRVLAQDAVADPEAVALLEQAATTMAGVQSFRFGLTTEGGTTTILEGITVDGIDGAVQRPDRFEATITATVAFVNLSLRVVGVGSSVWVQDPLSSDGGYREVGLGSGLEEVVNPDRLLLRAVELVRNPTLAGEDEVDGIPARVVEGEFLPTDALSAFGTPIPLPSAEDEAEMGIGLVLDQPLFTQIWIDGENRVIQMAFQGALTTLEAADIVRVLRLTAFDEPIDIQPPTPVA